MTRLVALLAIAPAAANAHDGAHLHPHAVEWLVALLLAAAAIAAGAALRHIR